MCACENNCPVPELCPEYQSSAAPVEPSFVLAPGVGGPAWEGQCNVYRGPDVPTNIIRLVEDRTSICLVTGDSCDPIKPTGLRAEPFVLNLLASAVAGTPSVLQVRLSSPLNAILTGVVVSQTILTATGLFTTSDGVLMGRWKSNVSDTVAPNRGTQTLPAILASTNPGNVMMPVEDYGRGSIVDGVNLIPPYITAVNIKDSAWVEWDFENFQLTGRTITGYFLVRYLDTLMVDYYRQLAANERMKVAAKVAMNQRNRPRIAAVAAVG